MDHRDTVTDFDLPEGTFFDFTIEYSVHGAMIAIYSMLGVDRAIPPIYQGLLDPAVALSPLECVFH